MTDTDSKDRNVIILLDELLNIDINKTLSSVDGSDRYALTAPLREAANTAEANDQDGQNRAFRFLHDLMNIHLRAENPAEPFGPIFQTGSGRSCTASDFQGKQNDIIAEFAPTVDDPVLRARLADIAWYNDRKKGDVGKLAVAAYCQIVEKRMIGELHRTHGEDEHILDMADYLQRAMQIAARVYKKGALPSEVKRALKLLFNKGIETREYVAFVEVAKLGLRYHILEWQAVVSSAEQIVANTEGKDYPMAVQSVWRLAAQGYGLLEDVDNEKRCQKEVVLQDLKMREQVDQASAKAHWVRTAIDKLRQYGGFKDWIADLRKELRELEEASLDDFVPYSYELDVTELATGTIEVFEKLTLPDILLQFALLNTPISREALEKYADDSSEKYIFSNLFSNSYSDRDGKVIAQTGFKSADAQPSQDWYKANALQYMEIYRKQVVVGKIEPARQTVMANFPLEPRNFMPIIHHSPFVQHGYEMTFALGFARLWQGDYISAANLLIPQLENAIRYVLRNSNEHSAKLMDDLTQDDRSISSLLINMRKEMEKIFGVDLTHEIDLLFNFRPGPALRHTMAHGKLTDGQCYSSDTIYGCWLIYFMTCLPLVSHWENLIAPEIEAQTF
ncbi:MAG: hypothetical protein AAGI28_02405 [Pseudomonadota bacterium]